MKHRRVLKSQRASTSIALLVDSWVKRQKIIINVNKRVYYKKGQALHVINVL